MQGVHGWEPTGVDVPFMTVEMLSRALEDLALAHLFAPDHTQAGDSQFCIESDGEQWRVFLFEAGKRQQEEAFPSETQACFFLLGFIVRSAMWNRPQRERPHQILEASPLPDGSYAVWNGRPYRRFMTKRFVGNTEQLTICPIGDRVPGKDEPFSFGKVDGEDRYYKVVHPKRIDEAFTLTTYCYYKNQRFQVTDFGEDGNLVLTASVEPARAQELGLAECDGRFYGSAHVTDVTYLYQARESDSL